MLLATSAKMMLATLPNAFEASFIELNGILGCGGQYLLNPKP